MASIFRSEKMVYTQLFLQSDSAYACIRELGELVRILVTLPSDRLNAALSLFHYPQGQDGVH